MTNAAGAAKISDGVNKGHEPGPIGSTEIAHDVEAGNPPFDVLTVSDMCVDLILRGNVRPRFGQQEQIVGSYSLELGGSANIFASQIARLGLRSGVLGYAGSDLFGDFAVRRLTECGVDVSLVRRTAAVPTGLGVHLDESGDRAILTATGTIDATQPADLPVAPEKLCRHWHLASPFLLRSLRSSWSDFLHRARTAGVTISFDPNWDTEQEWHWITDLLPSVNVFLPNEAEAKALTGADDPADAARQLAKDGPLVIVKCGSRGAIAVNGNEVIEVGALPVPTRDGIPVDTVGAGDNFDAGFVAAWISHSPLRECLSLGSLCASASLACAGGIAGQLTGAVPVMGSADER